MNHRENHLETLDQKTQQYSGIIVLGKRGPFPGLFLQRGCLTFWAFSGQLNTPLSLGLTTVWLKAVLEFPSLEHKCFSMTMAVQDLLLNAKWRFHWWLNRKFPGYWVPACEIHIPLWRALGYVWLWPSPLPSPPTPSSSPGAACLLCVYRLQPPCVLSLACSHLLSQPGRSTCLAVALAGILDLWAFTNTLNKAEKN